MTGKAPVRVELVGGPADGKQLAITEPLPPNWHTEDHTKQRSEYVLTDRQTTERRIIYHYQRRTKP